MSFEAVAVAAAILIPVLVLLFTPRHAPPVTDERAPDNPDASSATDELPDENGSGVERAA